jgi:hypothetical protein
MEIVTPGWTGRRRPGGGKLPPGQYLVTGFPVLSAGPTMIRTRAAMGTGSPFRLVYSVRGPGDALYAAELAERQRGDDGLHVA